MLKGAPKLPLQQIHARFAFSRKCRYFALKLNKMENVQYDEIIGFFHSNGYFPMDHDGKTNAVRCTCIRDGNTSAFMGSDVLFYAGNEKTFMEGYYNLVRNISPILTNGAGVKVYIVSPESNLIEPQSDLPEPKNYEALIPKMCSWSTTSIAYMEARYEATANFCYWLAAIYLPCFSMPTCGLLGLAILRLPKFADLQLDALTLYYFDNIKGTWTPSCTAYNDRYIISYLTDLPNK